MTDRGINSALGIGNALGPSPANLGENNEISAKASSRYIDGYRIAGFIVGFGTLIKVLGVVAGMFVFVMGLVGTSNNPFGRQASDIVGLVSFLMGAGVWFVFFIAGIIVSAQGQQLKATLDSAVHSSPFLDPEAKARAMNLL